MYTLIIADDERRIREGLRNMVEWDSLGFTVSEVFSDGQEVIDYLEYMTPDVILTDIKMNHVSGIDIAKYVHENKLPCKVILISGHQEFKLALEGIRYGVEDYLLKPTDISKIEEVFIKIKHSLDKHAALINEKRINRDLAEVSTLLEDSFWQYLVMGAIEDRDYIRSCTGKLCPDIDISNCECFLVDISIMDYTHFINVVWECDLDQIELEIKKYLYSRKDDFIYRVVYKSGNLIELIGIRSNSGSYVTSSQSLDSLLRELEAIFKFQLSSKLYCNCKGLFQIHKEKERELAQEQNSAEIDKSIRERKLLLLSSVSTGNILTAQKMFHAILDDTTCMTRNQRVDIVIDIMSKMHSAIWNVNASLASSIQPMIDYGNVIYHKDIAEISDWADRIFDRIRKENLQTEGLNNSLMNRAKEYIKQNIHRDISQEETANYLYISSSYLSRLFRKQTGETYMQYVTRIKMEKAIELLKDPQFKTYQVGDILGYKTSRYFSKLFHAHTGMNPSEYRKLVLHLGGDYEKTEDKT